MRRVYTRAALAVFLCVGVVLSVGDARTITRNVSGWSAAVRTSSPSSSTSSSLALNPATATEQAKRLTPPVSCPDGRPIRGVTTERKVVSFTFDDGPWPNNTSSVMDSFEAHGAYATFFMIGDNVNKFPEIAKEVAARGHGVGNHSMTHRYSKSGIVAEMPVAQQVLERTTGAVPKWFRAPGLTLSSKIDEAAAVNHLCAVSTRVDLGDWRAPRASSAKLCNSFAKTLKPGDIVLLHDGGSHRQTVEAVGCMLDYAQTHGFTVVSLDELLRSGVPYY